MKQKIFLASFLGAIIAGAIPAAVAQTNSYQQTNLLSNIPGFAAQTDPNLVNAWGIAIDSGQTFFIADNHRGIVKAYYAFGDNVFPGLFAIPPHAGSTTFSKPSGIVVNPTDGFVLQGFASHVLIATDDGTISGWATENGNLPEFATQAIDNSPFGAVYKGLAVLQPACCAPFLAVTNFHSGFIEPYTSFFAPLGPPGSFDDPALPAGYAPFGIQLIGKQVFVTYAMQDGQKHNPALGAGLGLINVFDLEGNFIKRFATHGALNAPWGVAKAGAKFGRFSNAILVGNFGDGTISAFAPATGRFLGQLEDVTGKRIVIPGLWGLKFGNGGDASPHILYFTAGPNHGNNGLFGTISAN